MSATSATEKIKERSLACQAKAGPPLKGLAVIATRYSKDELAGKLAKINDEIVSDAFRVIVLGRFSNGKSTVLNALLGRTTEVVEGLPQGGAPLPSSDMSCTAILTSVSYAKTPSIEVIYKDEKQSKQTWSLSKYLLESRVRPSEEENKKFFEPIREFKLNFPAELCKAGITLIDSPGTDDDQNRDLITLQAIETSDAAIVLFRSDALAGTQEREYVQDMIDGGMSDFFMVVNLWGDDRKVDQELKTFTWEKLVKTMLNGPAYKGQNLEERRIYFVQAKRALEGKLMDNQQLIRDSGLAFFEEHLRQYLETEKRAVHMTRFVQSADSHAQKIKEEIERRIPALQVDQQKLEANYEAIKPQLAEVRRKKAAIPKIIASYRDKCILQLQTSFEELINDITRNLAAEVQSQKLTTLSTFGGKVMSTFSTKKIAKEATDIAGEIVQGRVKAWQTNSVEELGARKICARVLESMFEEISDQVTAISSVYEELQVQLTGAAYNEDDIGLHKAGWAERTMAAGLGVLTMQPDYVLMGGAQGFRGIGRDVVGRLAVGGVLAFAGAPLVVFAPAVILAGLVTNILWGSSKLEKDIKEKMVQLILYGNPKTGQESLQSRLSEIKPLLSKGVTELFERLDKSITSEVEKAMKEQEDTFQSQLNDSKMNVEEKVKTLKQMNEDLLAIVEHRKALQGALVVARQT